MSYNKINYNIKNVSGFMNGLKSKQDWQLKSDLHI